MCTSWHPRTSCCIGHQLHVIIGLTPGALYHLPRNVEKLWGTASSSLSDVEDCFACSRTAFLQTSHYKYIELLLVLCASCPADQHRLSASSMTFGERIYSITQDVTSLVTASLRDFVSSASPNGNSPKSHRTDPFPSQPEQAEMLPSLTRYSKSSRTSQFLDKHDPQDEIIVRDA